MVSKADKTIFSIQEITRYIKSRLDNDKILKDLWLTGEISNFTHHGSGHMYFSLKDEDSRIKSVMFRGNNRLLDFEPEDGMEVTAHGYVSVYPRRGEYQFYVDRLEREGRGALYRAFEKLKTKLKEEGLFDEEEKKEIPILPGKIGIVTSPSGAAIRDILSVVDRRFEHVSVLIVPSCVQGERAAGELVTGIEYLNKRDDIDLIIVSRGGGSIEDLWAFNKEVVARAVYNSSLPVISGVGHETDFTITDFCADLRAPTPSAAAELAVSSRLELEKNLDTLISRLENGIKNYLNYRRERFLSLVKSRVFRSPMELFSSYVQFLDELKRRLNYGIEGKINKCRDKFNVLSGKLDTLSPLKTLERGYTITESDGNVVSRTGEIKEGDELNTRVTDGRIISRIKEIVNREDGDLDE